MSSTDKMVYRDPQLFLTLLVITALLANHFEGVNAKIKKPKDLEREKKDRDENHLTYDEDMWRQHESLEEIRDQIKWGVEQSSRMDKKKKAHAAKTNKKENAEAKTCIETKVEETDTCDSWYCTMEQRDIIVKNTIFSLMMLLVIPLSLLIEKVYKKISLYMSGDSNVVKQKEELKSDVEMVTNKVMKIRRRLKLKPTAIKG